METHHEIRIALGEIYTSGVKVGSLMERFQEHTGGQGHRNLGNCQQESQVSHGPAKQQSRTHPSVRGQSHGGLTETRESRVIRGNKGTTSRGHWQTWSIPRSGQLSRISARLRILRQRLPSHVLLVCKDPTDVYKGPGAPKVNRTKFVFY